MKFVNKIYVSGCFWLCALIRTVHGKTVVPNKPFLRFIHSCM